MPPRLLQLRLLQLLLVIGCASAILPPPPPHDLAAVALKALYESASLSDINGWSLDLLPRRYCSKEATIASYQSEGRKQVLRCKAYVVSKSEASAKLLTIRPTEARGSLLAT